jgi:hypothetical protein
MIIRIARNKKMKIYFLFSIYIQKDKMTILHVSVWGDLNHYSKLPENKLEFIKYNHFTFYYNKKSLQNQIPNYYFKRVFGDIYIDLDISNPTIADVKKYYKMEIKNQIDKFCQCCSEARKLNILCINGYLHTPKYSSKQRKLTNIFNKSLKLLEQRNFKVKCINFPSCCKKKFNDTEEIIGTTFGDVIRVVRHFQSIIMDNRDYALVAGCVHDCSMEKYELTVDYDKLYIYYTF